jgi:tRNA(Ile)-lysidine synthase
MIRQAIRFDKPIYVAVSGGVDSMVALSLFLQKEMSVSVLHFNHNTDYGNMAEPFVRDFCNSRGIPFHCGRYPKGKATEKSWRDARYSFFDSFTDKPIITCHHLNDAVEWWLFTALRGQPRLIPTVRGNYYRPFMLTPKVEFINFAKRKGIDWLEDVSNAGLDYDRNYIRNEVVPVVKRINPGLEKTIFKKMVIEYDLTRVRLSQGNQ